MNSTRFYDHVVSLGLNCETAFQLYSHHGNVESSMLAWAAGNCASLADVLVQPEMIFSERINHVEKSNMFFCEKTGIGFHGRKLPEKLKDSGGRLSPELAQEEREECKSRVAYLIRKFYAISSDNSSKLFVLGCQPYFMRQCDTGLYDFILTIFYTLKTVANNFHLLAIVDAEQERYLPPIPAPTELHIRVIRNFSPYNKISVLKYADMDSYARIFSEFMPRSVRVRRGLFKAG